MGRVCQVDRNDSNYEEADREEKGERQGIFQLPAAAQGEPKSMRNMSERPKKRGKKANNTFLDLEITFSTPKQTKCKKHG